MSENSNQQGKEEMNITLFGKLLAKMRSLPRQVCRTLWQIGQDDPRRVIHAFKVGLALTLVSLLYLLEPLFEGIGQNAIWAVMTVVVVLEFTVGKTGENRFMLFIFSCKLNFTGFNYRSNFMQGAEQSAWNDMRRISSVLLRIRRRQVWLGFSSSIHRICSLSHRYCSYIYEILPVYKKELRLRRCDISPDL